MVLRTALAQGEPVFVASGTEPRARVLVQPGSLYRVVRGWWVIPDAVHAAALCDMGA